MCWLTFAGGYLGVALGPVGVGEIALERQADRTVAVVIVRRHPLQGKYRVGRRAVNIGPGIDDVMVWCPAE